PSSCILILPLKLHMGRHTLLSHHSHMSITTYSGHAPSSDNVLGCYRECNVLGCYRECNVLGCYRECSGEFIPIKSWAARGSGAPGNCAGHSRPPSPSHEHPASTGGSGLSQYDNA